jgi:hypothetical protein
MKSALISVIVALATSSASAFAPSTISNARASTTKTFAEDEKKTTELVLDTNFDEVNIVKLLGLKKVRKIMRKNKRKSEGEGK